MKVKIIRHGERADYSTPWKWAFSFGHYWADPPLTENGVDKSYQKGIDIAKENNFNPKYIYSSPYLRTMMTATQLKESFPESKIVIENLLSEYQNAHQHSVGLYPKGISTKYNGIDTGFSFPESYNDFNKRAEYILKNLIKDNLENDLFIVTHGEMLKSIALILMTQFKGLILNCKGLTYLSMIVFDVDIDGNILENTIKFIKN